MGTATSASFSEAPGSEPRTLAALLLESIALRHQIAVLERSRTRRPCFRLVPFANEIERLLTEALTETVGVVLPGALTAEYTVVATLLGPLAPTAGSHAEVLLRMGLVIASVTGVGVLIGELAWLVDRGHRQRPQTWICPACSAGNHQQCRGALLLVARTSEGARPCQCKHCTLNR
jgi:hypothetical protein